MNRADGPSEEAALMMAVAARGDRDAFAELFRRYAPRVKAQLIARRTPADVADELTQETMLLVWRKAALFDAARGSVATWVFTISRNCLLNRTRAAAAKGGDSLLVERDTPLDNQQQLIKAETARVLAASVEQLPAEQRAILVAAYWKGQTLRECADEAKIPLGTAKTRVRLALARLRELLQLRSTE